MNLVEKEITKAIALKIPPQVWVYSEYWHANWEDFHRSPINELPVLFPVVYEMGEHCKDIAFDMAGIAGIQN